MAGGPSAAIRAECPNATEQFDGLMSKQDKTKLDNIPAGSGGGAFVYTVKPGDNSDFQVPIPLAKQPLNANYIPMIIIGTANTFTGLSVDLSTLTTTTFRVTTDAPLPVGTSIGVIIEGVT